MSVHEEIMMEHWRKLVNLNTTLVSVHVDNAVLNKDDELFKYNSCVGSCKSGKLEDANGR